MAWEMEECAKEIAYLAQILGLELDHEIHAHLPHLRSNNYNPTTSMLVSGWG